MLRYFESREAVLLELLDVASREWLEHLDGALPALVDAAAPLPGRADRLAAALAASLADRPVLCDLVSAQAAVLERNVSPRSPRSTSAPRSRTSVSWSGSCASICPN